MRSCRLRVVPVALAFTLQSVLGLAVLTGGSGCGGEESKPELTPTQKQNVDDELKAEQNAKNATKNKRTGGP